MSQRLRRERAAIQHKSKWRVVGFVVAGILGVVVVLGVIGLLLILRTTPPPVIHTDPAAARRLEEKLRQAQINVAPGTPRVVRADETEINSMLQQQFDGATNKTMANIAGVVHDMKLTLAEDRLKLYVLVNSRERNIAVQLEGHLQAVDGYIEIDPVGGKIGSLPLPKAAIKKAMEKMLASPEGRETMRLPKNVRDLHVEGGKLVIVFR